MPSDTRCPTTTCWYYSLCCYGNGDAFPNACKDAVAWFHTTPEQVGDAPRSAPRCTLDDTAFCQPESCGRCDTPRDEVMAALEEERLLVLQLRAWEGPGRTMTLKAADTISTLRAFIERSQP